MGSARNFEDIDFAFLVNIILCSHKAYSGTFEYSGSVFIHITPNKHVCYILPLLLIFLWILFFSADNRIEKHLKLLGKLSLPSAVDMRQLGGLPSAINPSDHISLAADFLLMARP